ncbi:hypothetical protein C0Q44_22745 [Paenibacillus sp. PCH8]|nr:hypothetical protein C0Q44_22745 [Paenibacillus sp. PCH8]
MESYFASINLHLSPDFPFKEGIKKSGNNSDRKIVLAAQSSRVKLFVQLKYKKPEPAWVHDYV